MVNHRRWLCKISLGSLSLDGFGFAARSFRLHPVFGSVSSRVPPGNAMSRFAGFGDKSWDNFKNSFQTRGDEFSNYVPKGTGGSLLRANSAEKVRFETQPPFSVQAASCNRRRINAGGSRTVCKIPGHRTSLSVNKASSLRWLAYELNQYRDSRRSRGISIV